MPRQGWDIADKGGVEVSEPMHASSQYLSIPAILRRNAETYADKPAYREKDLGIWQSWTWSQAEREIESLAIGFLDLGVSEGDFIAIAGRNRPHFYWSMVAAQMVGAIPVPIYHDSAADEMAYVLDHCGACLAVVEDQEQIDKILDVQEQLSRLKHMNYVDSRGMRKYDHARLHQFSHVQDVGRSKRDELTGELEARRSRLDYSSTCVMLYTSGTTGKPKGVVLSNRNIIESSIASCKFDGLGQNEEVLAYLPMAWVGDFMFSIGQAFWSGFCVNCPESADTMQMNLREIGPTYYFAPPRVFEMQLTNVMIRMEDAGILKKRIFGFFMDHAKKVGPAILDRKRVGGWDRLKYWLGNLIVYGPLKDTLGFGRVRLGYTAGEAIGPEIFEFYRSLGINLKQLYGQTEASVFVTIQPEGEVRADTVGVPAPGVQVKVADSGEVFYRGPGTFVEYYKNPESTAKTKDADGWVATGDAGFMDGTTGHLKIIDRAKDVGKMSSGKMFAPKYVENKLKFFPDILEAVVFGNQREECTAFMNIDLNAVGNWAERNNIGYASYQELASHPRVLETIREHVEEVNLSLSEDPMLAHSQIHRFIVLHKELDADDGEITRTRKVRRGVISEKYEDLLGALYDGSREIYTTTEVTYEDGRKGSISATLKIMDAAVALDGKMEHMAAG